MTTIELTREHVIEMLKGNDEASEWYDAAKDILQKYDINTVNRLAGFFAQTAHESLNYTVLEENLNYSASGLERVFSKYFSKAGRNASQYARNPEAIANIVYADRMGNGSTQSGDGWKFRGRGIIQLTGRENYTRFGQSIGMTPDQVIDYLKTKKGSIEAAAWYWNSRKINEAADRDDNERMTRLINGGTIGLADRNAKYSKFKEILRSARESRPRSTDNPVTPSRGLFEGVVVKRGDSDRARGDNFVTRIQRALRTNADGVFGVATERTLKSWQARNGIRADGVARSNTLSRLLE